MGEEEYMADQAKKDSWVVLRGEEEDQEVRQTEYDKFAQRLRLTTRAINVAQREFP